MSQGLQVWDESSNLIYDNSSTTILCISTINTSNQSGELYDSRIKKDRCFCMVDWVDPNSIFSGLISISPACLTVTSSDGYMKWSRNDLNLVYRRSNQSNDQSASIFNALGLNLNIRVMIF